MVDNLNPTNQFHPYQAVTDTPNVEKPMGGLSNMNWQDPINKARDYARNKPGMALGALAALAIGIGLLRRR
jgi:hypothetical protein